MAILPPFPDIDGLLALSIWAVRFCLATRSPYEWAHVRLSPPSLSPVYLVVYIPLTP